MTVGSPEALARLEDDAERFDSACAGGSLVWHAWGSGPPVVLLHGGSGSWTHWCRNIEALVASGHQVLVPDLPGFGDSSTVPGVTDADGAAPVVQAALRERLGDTPFDLVGFSFGSLVATLMSADQALQVQRLVLVGAFIRGETPPPPLKLRPWMDLPPGEARNAVHRYNLGALMLSQAAAIDDFAVTLHDANLVRDRMRRRHVALTHLLARTLPRVACPVTAIWGSEDFAYRDRADTVHQALQAAPHLAGVHEIAGAGHWVQFEAAPAFDRLLHRILAF